MFLRKKAKSQNAAPSSSTVPRPELKAATNVDSPPTPLFARFATASTANVAGTRPMVSGPMTLGTRKFDLEGAGPTGSKAGSEWKDVQKHAGPSSSRSAVKPEIRDKPLPPPVPAALEETDSGLVPEALRMGSRFSTDPYNSHQTRAADTPDSTASQSLLSSRSSSTRKLPVQDLPRKSSYALTSASNGVSPSDPDDWPTWDKLVSRPAHEPPSSYRVGTSTFILVSFLLFFSCFVSLRSCFMAKFVSVSGLGLFNPYG
jgi:hypothetical protein